MPQQLKAEVRAEMLRSAEAVFFARGYAGATMSDIARHAGISTGNLYRYFENKDALFYTVVTDGFVEAFLERVRRRVRSLAASEDLAHLGHAAHAREKDLLDFWIEHRRRVVILLEGAAGTRYEGFAAQFADELVALTSSKLRGDRGGHRLRPVVRFTLEHLFAGTVRSIGAMLRHNTTESAIREAFRAFWSYQLAGLAGFERWVARER